MRFARDPRLERPLTTCRSTLSVCSPPIMAVRSAGLRLTQCPMVVSLCRFSVPLLLRPRFFVLDNGDRKKRLCVTDTAHGGTYHSTEAIDVVPGKGGLWKAVTVVGQVPGCG